MSDQGFELGGQACARIGKLRGRAAGLRQVALAFQQRVWPSYQRRQLRQYWSFSTHQVPTSTSPAALRPHNVLGSG